MPGKQRGATYEGDESAADAQRGAGSGLRTGIFYHPGFSRRSYLTQGARLEDFPQALNHLLQEERCILYQPEPISEASILAVHSRQLLEEVKQDPLCSTAWHSVGAVVMAAEKIASGEVGNAFSFIGAGGHHAGKNFFGGYCCFNDVAIAIRVLRDVYGIRRIAILDTDAHHGDGTRALVCDDPEVLHVCVCSNNYESEDGTNVDIATAARPWDEDPDAGYARTAIEGFRERARRFGPEFMFWYFGFDTHRGDYADIGLTINAYLPIARMMLQLSGEICGGRLEVVLGGGSRSDIARSVIPALIAVLGEAGSGS
jgi:acetoin utilization deacetylase AcuC-like enzyme